MQLGSFKAWLWIRVAQAVFSLWALLIIYEDLSIHARPTLFNLLFLLLVADSWVYFDSTVYGVGSEDGFHYRRYIKRRFLPWTEIQQANWKGVRLELLLRRRHLLRNRLRFFQNPPVGRALRLALKREKPAPLVWVEERIERSLGPERPKVG